MPVARSEGRSTPPLVGRPAEEGRPPSRTAGAAALGRSRVSEVVVIAAVTALPGRKPARAPGAGRAVTAEMTKIGRAHGLNSSHVANSYAVFCLKKKNQI